MKSGIIKLSVIIPVYGVERYIGRCAESLFRQTLVDGIEFIFVDDSSPDNSISVLKDMIKCYPQREKQVRIIRHDVNSGVAAARQTGLDAAEGEYVIYCDSDDWVEPDMYRLMLENAIKHKKDLVSCGYYGEYNGKNIVYNQVPGNSIIDYRKAILSGKLHNALWNKMFRKSILANLQPCFTPGLNYWEDVSVVGRAIYNCTSYMHIEVPMYHYNLCNQTAYTKNISESSCRNVIASVKRVSNFYKEKEDFEEYLPAVASLLSRGFFSVLSNIESGKRKEWHLIYEKENGPISVDSYIGSRINTLIYKSLLSKHFTFATILIKLKRLAKRVIR